MIPLVSIIRIASARISFSQSFIVAFLPFVWGEYSSVILAWSFRRNCEGGACSRRDQTTDVVKKIHGVGIRLTEIVGTKVIKNLAQPSSNILDVVANSSLT